MSIFIYLPSLVFLFILKPEKYEKFNPDLNLTLSIVYMFLLLFFMIKHLKINKSWMRFDVIFLLGYTLVHIQIPFLESIGIEPSRPYFIWINKEVVNYATWMSVLAINLWMLGYSFYLKKEKKQAIREQYDFSVNYTIYDLLLLVVFSGFLLTVSSVIYKGAYNVDSWGAGATHFLLLLKIFIYLRVIYFFKELPQKSSVRKIFKSFLSNKIFFSVITTYSLLFFLSGSRGEILRIILIIAFSYSFYIKKISLKFVVSSVLIGSFVFTIMGLGRVSDATQAGSEGLLKRGYTALIETDKRSNLTDELASSVRIQYRALDSVPDKHPYLYGVTYLGTIFGAIPLASGLFVKAFDIPYQYNGSAQFFTYLGQGNNITYGEGSEILADIYINFGIYGVFIVMFIFGFLSGKTTVEVKRQNFHYVLVYAILLITALSINRGTIFYIYKDLIYILFLHYLFSKQKKCLR